MSKKREAHNAPRVLLFYTKRVEKVVDLTRIRSDPTIMEAASFDSSEGRPFSQTSSGLFVYKKASFQLLRGRWFINIECVSTPTENIPGNRIMNPKFHPLRQSPAAKRHNNSAARVYMC
jgi:hypothetical protein